MSLTSTADGDYDGSSPIVPTLQAPRLPSRAQEFLRTPPSSRGGDKEYVTASWGSPYPQSDRSNSGNESLDSAPSSGSSPVHLLAIETPFLRPPPYFRELSAESQPPQSGFVSAAVLANRARRPARGLTEDWIRQHTAGDGGAEARHWLSDGTGDSETSSLSGSLSGDEAAWLDETDLITPKATRLSKHFRRSPPKYPRTRSSTETLKQEHIRNSSPADSANMPSQLDSVALDWASENVSESALSGPATPKRSASGRGNGSIDSPRVGFNLPNLPHTPTKSTTKLPPMTPRLKKKVPWKGKNILILLPRDDNRGMPGHAPKPLTQDDVSGIVRGWEKLGYNTSPFELEPTNQFAEAGNYSQSRREWPTWDDIASERQKRSYKVTLPDLNGVISPISPHTLNRN